DHVDSCKCLLAEVRKEMAPAMPGPSLASHSEGLVAGAVGSIDHPAALRHDTLSHRAAVAAIGVMITPAVARPDPEPERPNLHPRPSRLAVIALSGGRNRREQHSSSCGGNQEFPHFILHSCSSPITNASSRLVLRFLKKYNLLEPLDFRRSAACPV